MYVIKKLWIDTLENDDAGGYSAIGVVSTKDKAKLICNSKHVKKEDYPWPLNYYPFNLIDGDTVPRYKYEHLDNLSDMLLDDILKI